MIEDRASKRVIINFTQKCAFNCEWCYVSFNFEPICAETVVSIVERVRDLGFESITFGGGDPFQFKHLISVVQKAKELGLFVHVDTHGKALREIPKHSVLLDKSIDLIGLPLDGATSYFHDLMRSSDGHHELIISKLKWLKSHNVDVKLNTIISAVNIENLAELSQLVLKILPNRWSVYQYWPVGPAAKVAYKHTVEDNIFLNSVSKIDIQLFKKNDIVVEVNSAESRRRTYPILNHNGEIYLHTEYPINNYEHLGSIFNAGALELINHFCDRERQQAVSRYVDTDKRVIWARSVE